MPTRLLIARHGNTFQPQQIPTRIGRNTDLPLVEETLARNLGKYLKINHLIPTAIWTAPLQRTIQTAKLAIAEMQSNIPLYQDDNFAEIDYGPDENKTEADVELRLGKLAALKNNKELTLYTTQELQLLGKQEILNWNKHAIVPTGWEVNPQHCQQIWQNFATMLEDNYLNQTVMVVSSNGIIRFAPVITENFTNFIKQHSIKVSTGNLCIFEKANLKQPWQCTGWNINPQPT